jgi:hypothetical protein
MSPIIFCHYGNSNYLEYTLLLAKYYNSGKKIYLLGDKSNQFIAQRAGIVHIPFEKYDNCGSILDFKNKYKFIAGNKHGRSEWTQFVFLRWFYIREFLNDYDIKSFWHFDSDNFIAIDLAEKEKYFQNFDNTEQCGGICLNGYISSSKIVTLYTNHILDLFCDNDYIKRQMLKCDDNETFAFTEMAAYNDFKQKYKPTTVRLNDSKFNDTFDDCLAMSDGMEIGNVNYNNHKIKVIYIGPNNLLYFKCATSNRYIKVNSLNLSWMPFVVIKRSFYLILRKEFCFLGLTKPSASNSYFKVDFNHYPFSSKLFDKYISLMFKLKFWFNKIRSERNDYI